MGREHSEPRPDGPYADHARADRVRVDPVRVGPVRATPAPRITAVAHEAGAAVKGAGLLTRVERALGTGTAVYLPGDGWIRLTLPLHDAGPAPVTVEVLADTTRVPHGIAYLLPGGGLNFTADYFTPDGHAGGGLAHHLRRQGLLVVGVTPREDAAGGPADVGADRGLAAHRRDLAGVVAALDAVLRLPYQYAGHSAGGALALDAASHDPSPRLRRVLVLDTTGPYTGDPRRGRRGPGTSTRTWSRAARTRAIPAWPPSSRGRSPPRTPPPPSRGRRIRACASPTPGWPTSR
ncbi:hypothetical protein [Streptomyces sp. LN699]|uniref:hypothetical protein n=1 Tax=Streptomyces sp. LN699 TaxID=3112981 RepID=UPI0037219A34